MMEVLLLLTLAMPSSMSSTPETLGKTARANKNIGVLEGVVDDRTMLAQVGLMGRYVPEPAGMLGRPAPQADADDRTSRVDLALGVISLSAAMIATGLTSSCLAAKTCHETVPLTRWAFDRGPVWGVVGRAAVNGLIHYGVARWVPKGKWRTTTLAVLAAINVTNAVLDIRTLQKIEQDR